MKKAQSKSAAAKPPRPAKKTATQEKKAMKVKASVKAGAVKPAGGSPGIVNMGDSLGFCSNTVPE